MNQRERDALIEASVSAFRERDREGRLIPPSEWWDLSTADADELFRRQLVSRELERAADPHGWSATVRAVLANLR
ncbi:MAG: hypothetical protein ACKVX7_15620 [Planctomycetota bacterium]